MDEYLYARYKFAGMLCKAIDDFAYVVSGRVNIETHRAEAYGGWAGAVPEGTILSRAPQIAYGKFGELVLQLSGGLNDKLVMTPVPGNELSYGYMGGVAQFGDIVAVSKWAEEHDRLLALLTLYSEELTLHHAGFRFPNRAVYEAANAMFRNGMPRPAEDPERTYFKAGKAYREHQFFPYGPHDDARHWDFVTDDPDGFLNFVANAYGKGPVFFDDVGEHDPVGVVWITGSDGTKLGVVARKEPWKVEEA